MQIRYLIILFTAILMLVGCGGGGGSPNPAPSASPTSTPTPTPTPTPTSLDLIPDEFSFNPAFNVEANTLVESNVLTLVGFDAPTTISVVDGEYQINNNGFVSEDGTIAPGDTVQVRTTSGELDEQVTVTLSVGGLTGDFLVATTASDITPDALAFSSIDDTPRGVLQNSNTVLVTGIGEFVPVSISNGEFSVDGEVFSTESRVISADQSIQVRHTTSIDLNTQTESVLTIGDTAISFISTTRLENILPVWVEEFEPLNVQSFEDPNRVGSRASAAIDVDGDGDRDLVVAFGGEDDFLVWYESNSSGELTPREIPKTISNINSISGSDLDGDGDQDLVVSSSGSIAWFENNGETVPTFTQRSFIADNVVFEFPPQFHYVIDLDNDSDMDVIYGSTNGNLIAVFENDGNSIPSFGVQLVSDQIDSPNAVAAADINDDGLIDILVSSGATDTVFLLENSGDGFVQQTLTTSQISPLSLGTRDFDEDGDLDVLVGATDVVSWYENDGAISPNFTEHVITDLADGLTSLVIEDVDQDGDSDILFTSNCISEIPDDPEPAPELGSVVLLEQTNRSIPTFNSVVYRREANNPNDIAIWDADQDGIIDLAVSTSGGSGRVDGALNILSIVERTVSALDSEPLFLFELADDPDGDAFSYEIVGGADSALFTINNQTGELNFTSLPSGDVPVDTNGDNQYVVRIGANDGFTVNRTLLIEVFADDDDDDNDGVEDINDAFPLDPAESVDTDGDGIGNNADTDDDGDGTLDSNDNAPLDASSTAAPEWTLAAELPSTQVISATADGAFSVFSIDLDNDGDLDVLSALAFDDTISWYENDGGVEPVFTERVITTTADNAQSVYAADVDGDGDVDVLSASGI